MIILHLTDLHFRKHWFDWVVHDAPAHDVLVISGDLLDHGLNTHLREQQAWVSQWLESHPRPIVLASGWHDLTWDRQSELWQPPYWMRALRGDHILTDGQRKEVQDLTVQSISATSFRKGSPADLWVSHAPPAGTLSARRRDGTDGGDLSLAAAIRLHRPRWVLCGRVHDPVSWDCDLDGTTVLNPGFDPGARFPNHIVLNTSTGATFHVSGGEQPALDLLEHAIPSPTEVPAPTGLAVTTS